MDKTGKKELQYSLSHKIGCKMKAIKKDKEGHYLMVKGSIQEEDITIVDVGFCLIFSWEFFCNLFLF